MKVTLVVNSDITEHGKIGTRTYFVAKELFKRGYLQKVFCGNFYTKNIPREYFSPLRSLRILSLITRVISLYFITSPHLKNKIINYILNIFDNYIEKNLPVCNVLHTWDLLPKSLKKAKNQKSLTILDIQMAPVEFINDNIKPYHKAEFLKYKELIDYFLVPSRFTKDVLQELNISKEKIIYIPFGVDIKKFYPVSFKKERFVCLFVGTLSKRKGIHNLLKAWKELNLKEAELIICGRETKEFKEMFKDYKDLKNIKLKGYLDQNRLLTEYQNASIFILPSFIEGSAKVTYEAMACGLPVITTPNAGSVVRNDVDGFIITPGDVDLIKEKIKYFYDHPEEIKRKGMNAYQEIKKYTWETYAENIVNLYEKIYYERKTNIN